MRIRNCKPVLFLVLILLFSHPKRTFALVCTSPKKGAVGGTPLVGAARYSYSPYSYSLQITSMLKRDHIKLLRNNQNPDVCSLPVAGCEYSNEWQCCPAKMIKKTITDRGPGGYWLIFNEPMVEDGYTADFGKRSGRQAADDAAFTISKIKAMDPTANFIVGWLYHFWYHNGVRNETTIASEWANIAPAYGLNPDINQEIAGWHLHLYGLSYENRYSMVINHQARTVSPGKELWITEFGTLDRNATRNPCHYSNIDTAFGQTCIQNSIRLLNWLESAESPVTKYFYYSYGPCDPRCIDGRRSNCRNYEIDNCSGPLSKYTNDYTGDVILNNHGLAFAVVPNDNGVCRYSLTTPTPSPTPTPDFRERCNLDNDPHGLVNNTDKDILLGRWRMPSLGDINEDGQTNETDLTILLAYWLDNP